MENSKIEWCDHTVNFWWGCSKVSAACDHCYAENISNRFRPGLWGKKAKRWLNVESAVKQCEKLNRKAAKAGRIDKVFVNSMSDFFEDREDLEEARCRAWFTFMECKNLIFMLLTKRPDYANKFISSLPSDMPTGFDDFLGNVWIGTTVENQRAADKRLPELMKIPAAVRYISVEPMLEEIDLKLSQHKGLHWVICGGESGNKARPMDGYWALELQDQCREAGVPFFMKQGSAKNWPDYKDFSKFPISLQVREFPNK